MRARAFKRMLWRVAPKLLPPFIKEPIEAYMALRNLPEYKGISGLEIEASGLSPQGMPFVKLKGGFTFYGYPPSRVQQSVYRYGIDKQLRSSLDEAAFGVACDIAFRYLEPKDGSDHLSRGKFYDFKPGDVVVEVGAFIGYYAMRVAELVGESGHVIAIEAINENTDILKRNVEENQLHNVSIVPQAAWNSTGTLTLYREARQQASILRKLVKPDAELTVPCNTVDQMLDNLGIEDIDFVRIQVNGAEVEVLEGMTETLKTRPRLLVAGPYQRDGQPSWRIVEEFLRSHSYTTELHGLSIFAYSEN